MKQEAFFFLELRIVTEAYYGSIPQGQKDGKFGQFPENTARTAGNGNSLYLLNRENALQPPEK